MRDFFCFKNAREFNELFGFRHGTRQNKILLSFLKSKDVFDYDHTLMGISSMPKLKQICMALISNSFGDLCLKGMWYKLDDYCTDVYSGICQDGDNRSIRYRKDGSLYKMRSGKLFRKIILASPFGKILPEQVQIWLCEEFAIDWETYAASKRETPYKLVTGLNGEITFADIYGNGVYYMDDLHSCMTGRERHDFYDKSVDDCYPAALVEKDNPKHIVARCVVFNNVEDLESGKIFRLAERQYSSKGEQGMRMLISELKKAGLIDGYKCVGAACSESTNFVTVNDESLDDRTFAIKCSFKNNRVLSYQDSFKWYYNDKHLAINRYIPGDYFDLGSTQESIPIYYDKYHKCECVGGYLYDVWVNGERTTCHSSKMEDFVEFYSDWFHVDYDVEKCPVCGEYVAKHHVSDSLKSETTGKTYCSIRCKRLDELSILDTKKFYSVFDCVFADKASQITTVYAHYGDGLFDSYRKVSILKDTLSCLFELGDACRYRGKTLVGLDGCGNPIKDVIKGRVYIVD